MTAFERHQQELVAENVPLKSLADKFGTPTYIYAAQSLLDNYQIFSNAFAKRSHLICFAVKANSNLAVLNQLAQQQSGFDIVSGGELARVLKANGTPSRIVFSGIGKAETEIIDALGQQIFCFNVESQAELLTLQRLAKSLNCRARVSFRVNPDVDAKSHPHISTGLKDHKFGLSPEAALTCYDMAKDLSHIDIQGIACHIGSQIRELTPFEQAFQKMQQFVEKLKKKGIHLSHVNLGGGLGVTDDGSLAVNITDYAQLACQHFSEELQLILEPGRAIAANAGILLTKVLYLKPQGDKMLCIVDAGMNDFIRPALYDAYQEIVPVILRAEKGVRMDVVGPICESSDVLGKNRLLSVLPGDILAVMQAGAYGFTMSSQYNSRPRSAEIMIKGSTFQVVRPRETIESLFEKERHFI